MSIQVVDIQPFAIEIVTSSEETLDDNNSSDNSTNNNNKNNMFKPMQMDYFLIFMCLICFCFTF